MSNATMNTRTSIWAPVFDSLGMHSGVELMDRVVIPCSTFWGIAVLFSTILHSYQQCVRVQISLHPCQYLLYSFLKKWLPSDWVWRWCHSEELILSFWQMGHFLRFLWLPPWRRSLRSLERIWTRPSPPGTGPPSCPQEPCVAGMDWTLTSRSEDLNLHVSVIRDWDFP